ncbi:unnamed protein product [Owenia fusiformis]|uniref:Uncharacterized protein n=1 Tax=Owenia fusiformis TaxID=6347 RepID=A0A8S4Q1A4_OWEFU|nr:unnamed protein product [Owenia fusiformis]
MVLHYPQSNCLFCLQISPSHCVTLSMEQLPIDMSFCSSHGPTLPTEQLFILSTDISITLRYIVHGASSYLYRYVLLFLTWSYIVHRAVINRICPSFLHMVLHCPQSNCLYALLKSGILHPYINALMKELQLTNTSAYLLNIKSPK